MALEQDIQELTAAVKALTAALGKSQPAAATKPKKEPETEKSVSDTTQPKQEPAAVTASSQAGATPPSTEETVVPEGDKPTIEFKDLVAVATELNKKDWKKLGAICEREKVTRISGLAESRWKDVHDEIVEILKNVGEGLV